MWDKIVLFNQLSSDLQKLGGLSPISTIVTMFSVHNLRCSINWLALWSISTDRTL